MQTISAILRAWDLFEWARPAGKGMVDDAREPLARPVLRWRAMHAIFFGLKRAHHGTLRITRDVISGMGLTAARFDMLWAIKQRKHGMIQSSLQRALGVCRATISRMLRSLEQLGLVMRKAYPHDRRTRLVHLTTLGKWRIGFAYRHITASGWAQLSVDSALAQGSAHHWCDQSACIVATARLEESLDKLRRGFRDRARLTYPWNPHLVDDIDPIDLDSDEADFREDTP